MAPVMFMCKGLKGILFQKICLLANSVSYKFFLDKRCQNA